MAILIIVDKEKAEAWAAQVKAIDASLDVRVWPKVGDPADIDFVLVWKYPSGELKKFPNLKCIASLGAGIDHILQDRNLPQGVPVTRVVEYSMPQSMSEYVTLAVLNYCRLFDTYLKDQEAAKWHEHTSLLARNTRVGIMGLGQLGGDAAVKLRMLGFPVSGWTRAPKQIKGITSYHGEDMLESFLSDLSILICLLPLTPATRNILNRDLFAKLPRGAYLINVARGDHLVEEDLLEALDSGQLSGACLDVFRTEPLPEDHPFWRHSKIIVTPHISSITFAEEVAPQFVENYRRLHAGQPLENTVNVKMGY
jgi:phosphoglycerate dehydrogenase-like enzyme